MKHTTDDTFKRTSIVVVFHEYATGPPHSLENFLISRTKSLLVISHPFVFALEKRSHYRFYQQSKLVQSQFISWVFGNQIFNTLKDIILTIFILHKYGKQDIFVGVDGVNACVGILLKRIGLVKHVIYYVIDYVPKRFQNKLLNILYHMIDRIAVESSDVIWNLADTMADMREAIGIHPKFRDKQIVVPVGTDSGITKLQEKIKYPNHAVHMGHLTEKQGVQILLSAIPHIITRLPDFHLDIFGGGGFEETLKKQCVAEKISTYVTFHGYIKDHDKLLEMMSERAMGIAPYIDSPDNFIRFTDPGKVKAYLATGLPVVVTRVPPIWKEIEKNRCGVTTNCTPKDLARSILSILTDNKLLLFRKNAYEYGLRFRWDKIFSEAFEKSILLFA